MLTFGTIDIALSVWPFPLTSNAVQQLASIGYLIPPELGACKMGKPKDSELKDREFRDRDPKNGSASRYEPDGLWLLHGSGRFQLAIYNAGNHRYHDHLLVSKYLCANSSAQQIYSQQRFVLAEPGEPKFYNAGKDRLLTRMLGEAHKWWIQSAGFGPLQTVTDELAGLQCPWMVSSGWAIDLFVGNVTRYHHDLV